MNDLTPDLNLLHNHDHSDLHVVPFELFVDGLSPLKTATYDAETGELVLIFDWVKLLQPSGQWGNARHIDYLKFEGEMYAVSVHDENGAVQADGGGYIYNQNTMIDSFTVNIGAGHNPQDGVLSFELHDYEDSSVKLYDFHLSNALDATHPGLIKAVNAGGDAFTSIHGVTYEADTSGGRFYKEGRDIENTTSDVLYQSERSEWNGFVYETELANGFYEVELKFAEIWGGAQEAGARSFDIKVGDDYVFQDLDLSAEHNFATAADYIGIVEVTDGILKIEGINGSNHAKISGFSIWETDATQAKAFEVGSLVFDKAMPLSESEKPTSEGGTEGETPTGEVVGLTAEYFDLQQNVWKLDQIDFDAAPVATQTISELNFYAGTDAFYEGGQTDNFAARYTGTFDAESPGSYEFFLNSDDGSKLFIDGVEVISNDGLHAAVEKSVTIDLSEGAHDIEVLYFERGGHATLDLDWSGPGFAREQMTFEGSDVAPVDAPPAATFEYTTPEEKLEALYPGLPSYTLEEVAAQINVETRSWTGDEITFSFPTIESPDYAGGNREGHLFGFGESQQAQARKVMQLYDDIIAVDVVEMGSSLDADIRMYNTDLKIGAWGGGLPGSGTKGDLWIHNQVMDVAPDWTNFPVGQWQFSTLIHEVGHNMGLAHTAFTASEDISFGSLSTYVQGNQAYSQMSYWSYDFVGLATDAPRPGSPMLADIEALQDKYGANMETRTGDDTYGFNSNLDQTAFDYDDMLAQNGRTAPFAIWDAGGNDTLDMSGFAEDSFISLLGGTFSSVGGFDMNVAIASKAMIENAIGGSGNDEIVGNAIDNVLEGGDGNDLLIGNAGRDTIFGGDGRDEISGGEGVDLLQGGADTDILSGGAGEDTFVLKTGSGADIIMDWTEGEDVFLFEDTGARSYNDLEFTAFDAGDVIAGYETQETGVYLTYGNTDDVAIVLGVTVADLDTQDDLIFA